jgi:hypothetical protein
MATDPSPKPKLRALRTVSWLFDDLIRIPGTNLRVGLDALIGLFPGGGDLVGGVVSLYALPFAARLGAPTSVILRMALNILIDAALGAVPLLGDLVDVGWKANRRNVELLEHYLEAPALAKRSSSAFVFVTASVVLLTLVAIGTGTVWLLSQLLSLL